ncbi:MAG: hypothetical protein ACP5OX_00680 [Minisyncoccia bacterium]
METIFKTITIFSLFLFLNPFFSQAAGLVPCGGPEEPECTICDLLVLLQNIIEFVIRAAFIICIVLIIYGGFRWLLSFGNKDNIAIGQKTIFNALVGLLIVLAAWLIIHTIFWLLSPKIEGIDNLKSTWFKLECYPDHGSGGSPKSYVH